MSQISTEAVRALVNYLTIRGVRRDVCFRALKKDEAQFNQTDFIESDAYEALYEVGNQTLGGDDLGFRFAQHTDADKWGILGNIAFTSSTLAQALTLQQKYQSLSGSIGTPIFQETQTEVTLLWVPSQKYSHHIAEEIITSWVEISRRLTNRPLTPKRVFFSHLRQQQQRCALNHYFGCPVTFGDKQNGLVIDKTLLLLTNSRANLELNNVLTRYADQLISKLSKQDPVSIASKFIRNALPLYQPKLSDLCIYLNASERSVQRQLSSQNTTFKSLLASIRQELSEFYLANSNYSIEEISALLSFSEPSAFIRAFKKWTQTTPAKFRTDKQIDI